ncbi:MAG: hypothetical protein HQK66_12250, partial [Desulfamplus sp.]|nr:hypothetical protein [Desulfamplus sp.]
EKDASGKDASGKDASGKDVWEKDTLSGSKIDLSVDLAALHAMMDDLAELLEDANPRAEEVAQALLNRLDGQYSDITGGLLQEIQDFQFEEAVHIIAELAGRLGSWEVK